MKSDGERRRRRILSLGLLHPRTPSTQAIRALEGVRPDVAVALYAIHGVPQIALDALRHVDPTLPATAIAEQLGPLVDRRAGINQAVTGALADLDEIAKDAGIGFWAIKGVAMRDAYMRPEFRTLGDLDVLLDSEMEAWALVARLRADGARFHDDEVPWFKVDRASGKPYGQMKVLWRSEPYPVWVDVHYGGYSVRNCGLLPTASVQRAGMALPSPEDNLLYNLANAAGDYFIRAKLLNDLSIELERRVVDWGRVETDLRSVGLAAFLVRALKLVRSECAGVSPDDPTAAATAGLTRGGPSAELWPPYGAPRPMMRWIVTSAHAARLAGRRSHRDGLRALGATTRLYRPDGMRWRKPAPHPPSRVADVTDPAVRNNWTCVRLLPSADPAVSTGSDDPAVVLADRPALTQTGGADGHRLFIGSDVFVPVVG